MSKIFNSVEDVERYLGITICIPKYIPEDCNVLCYSETTGETPSFYKEGHNSLHYIDKFSGVSWESPRKTLEQEVYWDNCYGHDLAYLRLATKDNSDVFTPDCLVGVETNKGFITSVLEISFYDIFKPSLYVYTTESLSKEDLYDVHNIKFFISDYSDETVSFREYVNKFYDGGICEDQ